MEAAAAPRPTDLFPHHRARPGQDQFLEDARSCLAQGLHLLAHAPTGMGKTAVSLSAGLEVALARGARLSFLTCKRSQHAAAIESLRRIWRRRRVGAVDLIAREQMCLARRRGGMPCQEGGECYFRNRAVEEAAGRLLSFPLHVQEAVGLCLRLGACPYLAALRAADMADAVVCDYNHFFSLQGGGMARPGKGEVLIVDEAHNLPSRIMDQHSASLGEADLGRARGDRRLRRFGEDLEALREGLLALGKGGEGRELEAWELDEPLERRCGTGCIGLARELAEALGEGPGPRHAPLLRFLGLWAAFGRGSARFLRGRPPELRCRLLEPSLVAAPALEGVHAALLMSGTLHPPEMFAEVLGISDRCACRRYPSPFPPQNRTVLALAGVTSRFQQRSGPMYSRIGERVAEVCSHVPGNLAFFFPSYEFMGSVLFHLRSVALPKKVLADSRGLGKNEREAMLLEMRREGGRALMSSIGGSFTEGVDFCDNLLSAVVVVGLPVPPPSEELDALTLRYSQRFGPAKARLYAQTYPALSKVLQAAGRAIRSERDRAAIVLLDERFLLPPASTALPPDFKPAPSLDLGAELDAFFRGDVVPHEKVISDDGVPSARGSDKARGGGGDPPGHLEGEEGAGEEPGGQGLSPP